MQQDIYNEEKMREAILAKAKEKGDVIEVNTEYVDEFAINLDADDVKKITTISLEMTDLMQKFDITQKEHIDMYVQLTKDKMQAQLKKFYNEDMAENLAKEKLVYIYIATKAKKRSIKGDLVATEIIDLVVNMAQSNLALGRKTFKKFVTYLGSKECVVDAIGYCKEVKLTVSEEALKYTLKMMKKFYMPMVKNSSPTQKMTEEQSQRNLARLYMDAGVTDITDHSKIVDMSQDQWNEFLVYLDKKYEAGELEGDWEMPTVK